MHLVLFFYPIHGITVGNQKKITGNENVYSIFVKCHHFYFNSCSQDTRYHHPTQYVYELNLIHAETWVVACRYVNEKKTWHYSRFTQRTGNNKNLTGAKSKIYTHSLEARWSLLHIHFCGGGGGTYVRLTESVTPVFFFPTSTACTMYRPIKLPMWFNCCRYMHVTRDAYTSLVSQRTVS